MPGKQDLDGLVALLREDVVLAMPPHALWFRGIDSVVRFFRSPRFAAFWSDGIRLAPTRANGLPAFGFHRIVDDGTPGQHSIMVARFLDGQVAEMSVFIGTSYFSGFDLPVPRDRTVLGTPVVMKGKGDRS